MPPPCGPAGRWQSRLRRVARNQSRLVAPSGKSSRVLMRAAPVLPRPLRLVRPRTWLRAFVGLGTLLGAGFAPAADEIGRPAFRDFPPGKNNIGFHFPAVAQDGAGYIHAANQWGSFIRYDGTAWLRFDGSPEGSGARKFARTAGGVLYAGGAGMLGFLRATGPAAEFVSLADRLPPALRDSLDLHDVLAVGETVYFAGEENILRWREGRFTVIPCPTPPRTRGARLHRVGETVYAAVPGRGLCRIVDNRLEEISTDPVFRDRVIILLEPDAGGVGGVGRSHRAHGVARIFPLRRRPRDPACGRGQPLARRQNHLARPAPARRFARRHLQCREWRWRHAVRCRRTLCRGD
jgi:hypothetical protein